MRKKILIGCSFILSMPVFFLLVATTTGLLLPAGYSVSMTALIPAEPQAVWDVMTDVENIADWNPIVAESELLEPVDGNRVWQETDPNEGKIAFREVAAEPFVTWITEVYYDGAPYQARWVYELSEEDGKTRVTIEETGVIPGPFLRFVMRLIVGNTRFQRTYLEALGAYFGDEAALIERVST